MHSQHETCLEDVGASLEDLCTVTAFLEDADRDFADYNTAYREFFASEPPARATVQAHLLGEYLVEIQATAVLDGDVTVNGRDRRPFPFEEIRKRQVRLAERLAEHGVAGVVASSYPGSYYLSGTPIHQFGRPAATLLTATGESILIASVIEQAHVETQATVDRVRYYNDLGLEATNDHPVPPAESFTFILCAGDLALGLTTDRVGFEEAFLPVEMLRRWQAATPSVTFQPVSRLLSEQRSVLSPAELALVRAADSVADRGQAALLEALAAGATAARS